ncbi:amidohydrolase family protein [Ornithinimicrobium sp. INDO-MA30-4]|uniref:amidohydrolase family protein n=1 Tax=Ornithinimicrobium sp. INDO-MA30-4 TaxID=2908651 RepID=UPI001F2783A7|nr:amidohydrolase family protein [Ornithinimicrobium sp. INDO-MA30-4]UJH70943.1 amidohydrolase family protein [Ornithinimicrobium sp. INDO-MA30-4]
MSTIYAGLVMDTPDSPFDGGALRAEEAALVVADGEITFRGSLPAAQSQSPDAEVVHLEGALLPGFVDTHVHYPQLPIIGGLGMPLMEWLEDCACRRKRDSLTRR